MKTEVNVRQDGEPQPCAAPDMAPGSSRRARIAGPVYYLSGSGRRQHIPLGPCLVEQLGGRCIDIIWGARGQSSVALPIEDVRAAQDQGHLVLLD